jgi:hypothetical protein
MATISDIASWTIADENITGNVGDTNLTLVTTDFHAVETLEVSAPADFAVVDIGVVGLGNSGGASTLDDLTDVAITTPSTGQVLKYNGTSWVNDVDATGGGAGSTNLSSSETATNVVVASDTGTDATIPPATGSAAGVMSAADKTKLDGIEAGAEVNDVTSVAGKTGAVSLVKGDVGLANVDNTSDANKPVSTAQQAALDGKQPLDSDLTAIAGLAPTNDDIVQRKAGAWTNRTPAQVKTDLALTKSDVGLANVDNTSDVNKPISTATQSALDGKQPLDSDLTAFAGLTPTNDDFVQRKAGAWTNRTPAQAKTDLALTKSDVGLSNVDNTSDANKPVSTAQQTALDGKQPLDSDLTAIAALAPADDAIIQRKSSAWVSRTMAQLKTDLALTKSDVGLSNVDNTSDANKPISTATQTALDARFVWADGTNTSGARPSTSSKVIWVGGTTQPTNMATGDLWVKA